MLAIFYFIVLVAITAEIVDSYIASIDSSVLTSHANPFNRTPAGNCAKCPYLNTCPKIDEWVSADVNAKFFEKNKKLLKNKILLCLDVLMALIIFPVLMFLNALKKVGNLKLSKSKYKTTYGFLELYLLQKALKMETRL